MLTDEEFQILAEQSKDTYLHALMNAYVNTRGAGHTQVAVKSVLNDPDAILIVASTEYGNSIRSQDGLPLPKNKFISLGQLKKLRGNRKPIILDNSAIFWAAEETEGLLESLVEGYKELKAHAEETEKRAQRCTDALDELRSSVVSTIHFYEEEAKKTIDRIDAEAQKVQCVETPECVHCHLLELSTKLKSQSGTKHHEPPPVEGEP